MINQLITRNIWKIIGLVTGILLSVYAFAPISDLGFAIPDDHWMLLKNEYVHPDSYNVTYFKIVFSRISNIQYSPLNTLYYSIVYKINGFDPYYYHMVNFLFHLFNTLLIYILTRKILKLFNIDNSMLIAYFVAVIWCVHPLNVETVTWISGSKIILCSFFTLLSFLFFVKAIPKEGVRYYVYSIIAFVLSCFLKEQAMITPFMFILTVICCQLNSRSEIKLSNRFKVFISFLIIGSLALCLFTLEVNKISSDYKPIAIYPVFQRLLLIFYCLCFYLGSSLMPVNLHYHYPFPIDPYQDVPFWFYLYTIFLTALLIYLSVKVYQSGQRYFYLLLAGIFLSQISLELQIIPMTRPAIMADRYMYLPLFALLIIFLHLFINIVCNNMASGKYRKLLLLVPIVYALLLSIYSHGLTGEWAKLNLIR